MNSINQVSSRKAGDRHSTDGPSQRHPLVPAIRVPLTAALNKLLWDLCLISGLDKEGVASLGLANLSSVAGELVFKEVGATISAIKGTPESDSCRSDPDPRATHIDVRVGGETLQKLKDWANCAGISAGEVAALVLLEATPEMVAGAQIALRELAAVDPESNKRKCA